MQSHHNASSEKTTWSKARRWLGTTLAASLALCSARADAQEALRGGTLRYDGAYGMLINDDGAIVGLSDLSADGRDGRAFYQSPAGQVESIDYPRPARFAPVAINRNGVVVGQTSRGPDQPTEVATYNPSTRTHQPLRLPETLAPRGQSLSPRDIDDRGNVLLNTNGPAGFAILFNPATGLGVRLPCPTLPCLATAMNERATIVGIDGASRPVVWDQPTVMPRALPDGGMRYLQIPWDVNDAGVIAARVFVPNSLAIAIWQPGDAAPRYVYDAVFNAINNQNVIVGQVLSVGRARAWKLGASVFDVRAIDLEFGAANVGSAALDINNAGVALGNLPTDATRRFQTVTYLPIR